MIRFYSKKGGAQDFELLSTTSSKEEWLHQKTLICRLLRTKSRNDAADLLERMPLELYDSTNGFGDDFYVLYCEVSIEQYVEFEEFVQDKKMQGLWQQIVDAFWDIGRYIRFIAAGIFEEEHTIIATPRVDITNAAVLRALRDVENLLVTSGPVSAVDRVHTILHGYFGEICARADLELPNDASITQLFSILRTQHPVLVNLGSRTEEVSRVLRAMSSIVEQLNTWRNRASIAHANEDILDEDEAVLAINAARTLLHYINSKMIRH